MNFYFTVIPSIVGTPGPEKPKFDWHQTDTNVTISIYTRRKKMIHKEHVLVDYIRENNYLLILVRLPDDNTTYNLAYKLEKSIGNVQFFIDFMTVLSTRWRFDNCIKR